MLLNNGEKRFLKDFNAIFFCQKEARKNEWILEYLQNEVSLQVICQSMVLERYKQVKNELRIYFASILYGIKIDVEAFRESYNFVYFII